jgi:hypothetical protein
MHGCDSDTVQHPAPNYIVSMTVFDDVGTVALWVVGAIVAGERDTSVTRRTMIDRSSVMA